MLYAKKDFMQFKKGAKLPMVDAKIAERLIADGLAYTKTKAKTKK